MAMTPRWRCSASSVSSLFSAPRSLNEAVNCRFSNFSQTCAPVIDDRVRDSRHGVRTTSPAIAIRAARTSSAVTGRAAAGDFATVAMPRALAHLAAAANHAIGTTKEIRMARVAFIGLGVMGFPMAGHLARAGHDVTVYNRTGAKADAWVEQHGGGRAATPAGAADGAELVFACVGNDDDLREVTLGADGAFRTMPEAGLFVDHTTVSAAIARELAEARPNSLDAPVSGGQAG